MTKRMNPFTVELFGKTEKDVDRGICRHKKKYFSDNIYTLDIEVSSLFRIGGRWQPFIYDDTMDYSEIEHAACPYIWMFGVEGEVFYGREFMQLKDLFKAMADPLTAKILYIFNMSYEMGFLLDVLEDYHICDMVARDVRKPIEFYVKELNIYFRCAYMLTNMSLETAAKEYTDISKRSGQEFDYNVARSPLTKLDTDHMEYCCYDILTLWKVIEHFRNEYDHVCKIPLTSTSIVRRALKDVVDYWYTKKQWSLVPEAKMFLRQTCIFAGGYCHTNVLHAGRIYPNIFSMDEASKYPGVMVCEMYPRTRFIKCRIKDFYEKRKTHAFFVYVKMDGVRSRYYNHYLQKSKAIKLQGEVLDNGRIARCDHVEYWLTDVDLDVIQECYDIDKLEIVECYKAAKDYLDVRIIKFILDLYTKKTGYKNTPDPHEMLIYKNVKPKINGLYGMSARNILKELTVFNDKDHGTNPNQWDKIDWFNPVVRQKFVEEKLEESKKSFSTLFQYVIGCWVSAFARRDLFMTMTGHVQNDDHTFRKMDPTMDRDVIYGDTDSCKYKNDHTALFQAYNRRVVDKYRAVVRKYPELDIEMFMPKDRYGIKHPINMFEDDGHYKRFIAIGAKKYAYEDDDGKVHITVSGVAKTDKDGNQKLKRLEDFKKGFKWGYKDSGKLVHYYIDDQQPFTFTDCDGNDYTCTQKHVVVLQPTSYTLGLTDWYEYLLNMSQRYNLDKFKYLTNNKMKKIEDAAKKRRRAER